MLSSGKGTAGDAEEEEEGSKHTNSLVLVSGPAVPALSLSSESRCHVPQQGWAAPLSCPTRLHLASVAVPTGQGCAGAHLCPQTAEQWGLRLFPLFLQLPGGEAVGQHTPWVSPAWQFSLEGSMFMLRGCSRSSCTQKHCSRAEERYPHGCGKLLGRACRAASPSCVQPSPVQPHPHHCCCSLLD